MSKQEKTFKHWVLDDLILETGLKEKGKCELLDNWLKVSSEMEDLQLQIMDKLLRKGEKLVEGWNEQELQTKYIAPIIEIVDFDDLNYFFASFAERRIEATYKNISLKGKVDWMVAIGRHKPYVPFFFIHEYKKQKGFENDPEGQLLATMLAAYTLNQTPPKPTLFNPFPKHDKDMPIYGCYIVGRWWYFVVLHKGMFCKSQPYDSINRKKLIEIIGILKNQKQIIIDRLEAAKSTT